MTTTTQQAIKRHDIDASYFQNVYNKKEQGLDKKETVFLLGRKFLLVELEDILNTLPKGSSVLDIGCGTAHLTNWIKNKGYNVVGIEPSNEMYNYATKNFSDIAIKKGLATNIPFEDNSFDFVVSFEVFRYLSKAENQQAYKEMYRVLKPNGYFFITQVNLFSTDGYFFFYNIKNIYNKMTKKVCHYTNFTTPNFEVKLAKNVGFSSVSTIGLFSGTTRLFYKINKGIGNIYWKIYSSIFNKNVLKKSFLKNTKAHLIVTGKK